MHDLRQVSWVGYVLSIYADPAQDILTAGEDLDDLDHHLSGLSGLSVRLVDNCVSARRVFFLFRVFVAFLFS